MQWAPSPDADPDRIATSLAERYLSRLRVFAAYRLGDPSAGEDAAQETLRRVLEALREGRVKELQALPSYIFETARHVCLNVRRQTARSMTTHTGLTDALQSQEPSSDPLLSLISQERRAIARQALEELAPDDRRLIEMSYSDGVSTEDIAARLGITVNNVRVRRHRILRRLGERVSEMTTPGR